MGTSFAALLAGKIFPRPTATFIARRLAIRPELESAPATPAPSGEVRRDANRPRRSSSSVEGLPIARTFPQFRQRPSTSRRRCDAPRRQRRQACLAGRPTTSASRNRVRSGAVAGSRRALPEWPPVGAPRGGCTAQTGGRASIRALPEGTSRHGIRYRPADAPPGSGFDEGRSIPATHRPALDSFGTISAGERTSSSGIPASSGRLDRVEWDGPSGAPTPGERSGRVDRGGTGRPQTASRTALSLSACARGVAGPDDRPS
jgi:hypothetical protein